MGIFPLFSIKGGITIESNIIYNFEDLRTILLDKTKKGSYYLLKDDLYFEEITTDTVISREVFMEARRILQPLFILKHLTFHTKDKYSTKQIYELVQLLSKNTNIIVTIFNPKEKECNLLFVSNKDDSIFEKHIKDFLEMEVI